MDEMVLVNLAKEAAKFAAFEAHEADNGAVTLPEHPNCPSAASDGDEPCSVCDDHWLTVTEAHWDAVFNYVFDREFRRLKRNHKRQMREALRLQAQWETL